LALPNIIPCKVSDEAAGYVNMVAVNRVDLPAATLVGKILAVTGKNSARIAKILARGSLVSDDSRFRWVGVEATDDELASFLETFPDDDPTQLFDPANCTRIEFQGPRGRVEISREIGRETRVLRRKNFWDEAMPRLAQLSPRYDRYSYSDVCDVFVANLTREMIDVLRDCASLIRYSSIEAQIHNMSGTAVVFYQPR